MTTTPTIALADLAENGPDIDVLRQMVQFMTSWPASNGFVCEFLAQDTSA